MSNPDQSLPYSHVIPLVTISGPVTVVLKPDDADRAAIARLGRLHSVKSYEARLAITPRADGTIAISGPLKAFVEPICVVSLEPFAQHVEEEVEAVFAEAPVIARLEKRAEEQELEFDPPDEIENNAIDIGALSVEFLMLALDPYPKKPGTGFEDYVESGEKLSPFAALEALTKKQGGAS